MVIVLMLLAFLTAAATPAAAGGQAPGPTFVYSQAAATVVMPFDQTGSKISFQTVSTINMSPQDDPVVTHWSYWADDCRHIRDINVCLTPGDTVVGPVFDLVNARGSVFVTAFVVDTGAGGEDCRPAGSLTPVDNVLIGSWTIADSSTNAAFGANAIGLASVIDGVATVPFDIDVLNDGGLFMQTFSPQTLGDGDIIVVTVDSTTGFGSFVGREWGPIRQPTGVCCRVAYRDNLEILTSHPDFCFDCTGFAAVGPLGAAGDDPLLLPSTINRPGLLQLLACETDNGEGRDDEIGVKSDQFLFAFLNQAVGQFGVTVNAVYEGEAFGQVR